MVTVKQEPIDDYKEVDVFSQPYLEIEVPSLIIKNEPTFDNISTQNTNENEDYFTNESKDILPIEKYEDEEVENIKVECELSESDGNEDVDMTIEDVNIKYDEDDVYDYKQSIVTSLQCEHCQNIFNSQYDFDCHQLTHENTTCMFCNVTFLNEEMLKTHFCQQSQNLLNTPITYNRLDWVCDYCKKVYKMKRSLREHIIGQHLFKGIYKCDICTKTYHSKNSLKYHQFTHKTPDVECTFCKRMFKSKEHLKAHVIIHSDEEYKCTYCDNVYKSKKYLGVHIKSKHLSLNSTKYKCDICFKYSNSKYDLYVHKRTHDKIFKCEICCKRFQSTKNLREHSYIHKNIQDSTCDYCGFVCSSKVAVKYHIKSHHFNIFTKQFQICLSEEYLSKVKKMKRKANHKCYICMKKFASKAGLYCHIPTHKENMEFRCDLCPKTFKSDIHLKSHLYTHNNCDFVCDYCNKEFKRKICLKDHILAKHLNIELHKCDLCSKSFEKKSTLNSHLITHKESENIHCKLCDKVFKNVKTFKIHLYSHRYKRHFICDHCGKAYQTKQSLKIHIMSQHLKLLSKCDICLKSFNKSYIYMHKLTHQAIENLECNKSINPEKAEEVDLMCSYCKSIFKNKRYLQNHVRVMHLNHKAYNCALCSKTFNTSYNFNRHKLENCWNVKCHLCTKVFKDEKSLSEHLEKHSKSEFKCNICGNVYQARRSLNSHILLKHSDKDSYKCEICSKSFNRYYLPQHMMTHKVNADIKCEICDQMFKSKHILKRHLLRKHPMGSNTIPILENN